MSTQTVAFLYPGAMGAGLAKLLHARRPALRLLTSTGARSPASAARAAAAGLADVPLAELVRDADVLLSILPPSAALDLAHQVAAALGGGARPAAARPLIYVDANAVAPTTVSAIARVVERAGASFVDGSVIGFPPTATAEPKFYVSAAPRHEAALQEVARVVGGGAAGGGLDVRVMPDAGEGAASALKMCYGGMGKGADGLSTLMILATADALINELSLSKPANLAKLTRSLPDMVGKAYRPCLVNARADQQWAGEMEEIASFLSTALGVPREGSVAATYDGIARVFQRVADDVRAREADGEAGAAGAAGEASTTHDVDVLHAWTERSKSRLAEIGHKG